MHCLSAFTLIIQGIARVKDDSVLYPPVKTSKIVLDVSQISILVKVDVKQAKPYQKCVLQIGQAKLGPFTTDEVGNGLFVYYGDPQNKFPDDIEAGTPISISIGADLHLSGKLSQETVS